MGVEDLNCSGSLPITLSSDGVDYMFVDPEKKVLEKQYTSFEELQRVEERRRAILRRTELPFWRILAYFEGTCLKAMSVDWLLWVTILVYVTLRVILRIEAVLPGADNFDFGETDFTVIGGFLSFFLVLFVNQSNVRFMDMYKTCQRCPARVYDIAQIVAPTFSEPGAGRLLRYLNAAHVAGYVGLSRTYSKREFFDKLNNEFQLLNAEELRWIERLNMDRGPAAYQELVTWCMMDIERAFKLEWIDAREKSALKDKATQFRCAMDELYDYCDQPVHFFYIHFLCLLSAVYLPLFAADNAFNAGHGDDVHWTWDVLSGLIVLVQAIFVIGLRLLGQKMSDPFGDDLEDLSVLTYVTETWINGNRIIVAASKCPSNSTATRNDDEATMLATEDELARKRKTSLGDAFKHNSAHKLV